MKSIHLLLPLFVIFILSACAPQYTVNLQNGQDVIGLYNEHTDAGCLLQSSKDDNYIMEVSSNDINNEETGSYEIIYTYTIDNDTYTCKRIVLVIDDIPPSVTLNPGVDTIQVNKEFVDAGVTATDETSDVTITTNSTVDTTTPGTYEITYTVKDEAGNTTFIKRVITIIE